jgi:uncharacterized membrane protein YedE/YeeE
VIRARVAAVAFGTAFGFLISWGTLTEPDTIREMLLLHDAYVFLMMGAAVAVGFAGVRLLSRRPRRALLTGEPVRARTDPIERRHIAGSAIFGLGWAIADTCPGPVAAQLGQGLPWALCTAAGVTGGVLLFKARRRQAGAARAPQTSPIAR